jgi:tetratricopeptide (TPR) repeat protein
MTTDDFGDQRAEDLVDWSMEQPSALAIQTLQKALTYGETGLYASTAYLELGNRYADIGDIDRAIESYTHSFAAYPTPNAYGLYWRGELYFRKGQWDKARDDFERAAALGLRSPESEQAQDYLSRIREKRAGQE